MNIPEFTAEASLYETSNRYRSLGQRGEGLRSGVIPQLGGRDYTGFMGCRSDCLDKHPYLSPAQCERMCRDPGHAGKSSDGWLNRWLSGAGITGWEIVCGAMVNPTICGWVADAMRRET